MANNIEYMIVCYNNTDEIVLQAAVLKHSRYEVEMVAKEAFSPHYHRVCVYAVREIYTATGDTHG